MPDYKYKAFISYRHIEPDMQAAEKLQKLLESYNPPKNITHKKEKWRIFRDVSELQSSSDLSEDIKNAIESSEFLIVICSPKYTESKWCLQELTRFRELHNNSNDNIITLLVSGEPQESFPEELTYREMTTTDENGDEVKVKVEVEPLAANIKADTLKESMKKLNTEYLRIAAPLLGCDFNDLFQREKRREAARKRRIFGAVSGVLSVITVISVASALTINKKNVQIKEQNEQIKSKNLDLLVENAGHLAVESENLYKENNLIPAIEKAVAALPADGEDKPVLTEAEYALSRELGMYSPEQIVPQIALKHDCAVEQLSFMGSGKSIVSQDAAGIYFWDAETGKLIKKITAADDVFSSEKNGSSNELTAIFDIERDKTGTFFDSTATPSRTSYQDSSIFNKLYLGFTHKVDDDEPGTGGDVYVYNSNYSLWRLDGATGEIKWSCEPSENAYKNYRIIMDEKYILRLFQNQTSTGNGITFPGNTLMLELIDRETGKTEDTIDLSGIGEGVFDMLANTEIKCVKDDTLYVYNNFRHEISTYKISNHSLSLIKTLALDDPDGKSINSISVEFIGDDTVISWTNVIALNRTSYFRCYDKDMKNLKWQADLPVNYQSKGHSFLFKSADTDYEHDVLAVVTASSVSFIDTENGNVLKNFIFESEILDVSFTKSGLVMFTLSDGNEYVINMKSYTGDISKNASFKVQTMNTSLLLCSYSRGRYVTAENYSSTAYIQFPTQNQMYTDIDTGENMYSRSVDAVTEDGSLAAISSTYFPNGEYKDMDDLIPRVYIYNTDKKELSEISELEGYSVLSAEFIGNDTLIAAVNKRDTGGSHEQKIIALDVPSGKVTEITDAPDFTKSSVKLFRSDDRVFYLSNNNHNITYISADGSFTSWAANTGNEASSEKEILDEVFAVSGSKTAVYTKYNEDDTRGIEISEEGAQPVSLECDLSSDAGLNAKDILWLSSEKVGVLFSNRTVCIYDSTDGKLITEINLDGLTPEPIAVEALDESSFAVLCRDSCVYSVNLDGSCSKCARLDFKNDTDNDIRESNSDSANKFTIKPSSDSSYIYAVWNDSQAWLLSRNGLKARYRIDNFAKAPEKRDIVFTNDIDRDNIGFFPIYTTQQLLKTAKEYLSGITAAGKD